MNAENANDKNSSTERKKPMNKNKLKDRFRPIPPIPENLTSDKLDELGRFIELECAKVMASNIRTKNPATLTANQKRMVALKEFCDGLNAKAVETDRREGRV